MNVRNHWNSVFAEKGKDDLSWFQTEPTTSALLIEEVAPSRSSRIIDVGAGTPTLAKTLLTRGFSNISLLDVSQVALEQAKAQLGPDAGRVRYIEASVTDFHPAEAYDVWHDRAVFHFLTAEADRAKYAATLAHAVPRGAAIIATFAINGPEKCSGLPVVRYDAAKIQKEVGSWFRLEKSFEETHATPWGDFQQFAYFLFRKRD